MRAGTDDADRPSLGFQKGKCTYMQHPDLCKLTKELKRSDRCTQFFFDANSTDKAVVRGENSRGSKCIVIKEAHWLTKPRISKTWISLSLRLH